jgi:tetratricopeptide (TPR) repeat protein
MQKSQILLTFVALLVAIALFQLPKSVVRNQENQLTTASNNTTNAKDSLHQPTLSAKQQKELALLRKKFDQAPDKEKKLIFADSLAEGFQRFNQFDSAAHYLALVAQQYPSKDLWIKAGNAYFEAFRFAVNAEKAAKMGEKAREFFQKVIEADPKALDIKTKMGVTFTATNNPMQGIALIREVLEKDPNNEFALLNLGMLSMQSKQYDKAVGRFEQILKLNPKNEEAMFYLSECYINLGQKEKGKTLLENLSKNSQDSLMRVAAKTYLNELN